MDLDEYMGEPENTDPDTMRPEDADAFLWRIRRDQRIKAEKERQAGTAVAKIAEWLTLETGPLDQQIATAEHHLENWMRAQHTRNPKMKTWSSPNGELRLRAGRTSIKPTDPQLLVKTLEDGGYPELVNHPAPTPKLDELKRRATPVAMSELETEGTDPDIEQSHLVLDGEILPGVHLERPTKDRFEKTIK